MLPGGTGVSSVWVRDPEGGSYDTEHATVDGGR